MKIKTMDLTAVISVTKSLLWLTKGRSTYDPKLPTRNANRRDSPQPRAFIFDVISVNPTVLLLRLSFVVLVMPEDLISWK